MAQMLPPQSAAIVKIPANRAWRGRTALACVILAIVILGLAASTLDWSDGLAMTLGQLVGMVAPLAVLSLIGWAAVVIVSRRR